MFQNLHFGLTNRVEFMIKFDLKKSKYFLSLELRLENYFLI